MPRRGQIAKRDVLPDPLYNSKVVTRLINNIMLDGKKGVAQKIVYGAYSARTPRALEFFEIPEFFYFAVLKTSSAYPKCPELPVRGIFFFGGGFYPN